MEVVKLVWDFFQNEILGMGWLKRLISTILNACGLDTESRIGGSIQFFLSTGGDSKKDKKSQAKRL